jgi:hypothetical protein
LVLLDQLDRLRQQLILLLDAQELGQARGRGTGIRG